MRRCINPSPTLFQTLTGDGRTDLSGAAPLKRDWACSRATLPSVDPESTFVPSILSVAGLLLFFATQLLSYILMVSMFHARHYPAGREVNPDDQPVPNGEHHLLLLPELRCEVQEC